MDQQASPPIARPRHDGEADLKAPSTRQRRGNAGGGWTQDKQAAFIVALRRTRNVTRAAAAAGMSRESAYRLRARLSAAGFAAAWDLALRCGPDQMGHIESHESRNSAAASVGFPAREHHESHGSGRTALHHQLHQLHCLSPARRAELLALIERAGRG
jgi:hypothetical protein